MSGSAEDAVRRRARQQKDKRDADERQRLADERQRLVAKRETSERERKRKLAILDGRIPVEVQAALERLKAQDYPGAEMFKVRRTSLLGRVRKAHEEWAGWAIADIVVDNEPIYADCRDDFGNYPHTGTRFTHQLYALLSTGEIVSGVAELYGISTQSWQGCDTTRDPGGAVNKCREWLRAPIQEDHAEKVLDGLLALANRP